MIKYIFFLFPILLQAQCLIPTHSYRLVCADEVRYADSTSIGSRLYISSKNAFVTSPRSVFSLVNGYGQHFIQITNAANTQKVAINRAWINRIDSTSSNKALIYIKDISVTFTSVESYTAVKDSAIACFVRSVASGLAALSDGDYGDVIVSGGGLVMTVDKPDLGLHNLADGDFSVVADSTALSLTNSRRIELTTKNIDGWISRYLQNNTSLTLRAASTTKTSRIFVDTTGANFQFINGSNNASLLIGDSVAVRFNTSGAVGDVLTVTSIDGDGRLVINPAEGGTGTANCEQTLTKNSHGFSPWTPIYWNGSVWARPTYDSIIPTYIVVDSTTANTFKVANCGNYASSLTAGLYYYKGASPGYDTTPTSIPTPLFEVAESRLILQPLIGFSLAGGSAGDVTSAVLADTAAAIRADFPTAGTGIEVSPSNVVSLSPKYFDFDSVNQPIYNAYDSTGWFAYKTRSLATKTNSIGEIVANDYVSGRFSYVNPFYEVTLDTVTGKRTSYMALDTRVKNIKPGAYDNVSIRGGVGIGGQSLPWLSMYTYNGVLNKTTGIAIDSLYGVSILSGASSSSTAAAGDLHFPKTSPVTTSGAEQTFHFVGTGTTATPSFIRLQHSVASGTTDASGDLVVTFAAAMPDATYTALTQQEGSTDHYGLSVHTKTTSGFKVRFFNSVHAALGAGVSVTISYEAKDY